MQYDMIIPIGEFCATAIALRECGLRKCSYPFDWSAGVLWDKCGQSGFLGKINLLCTKFTNAFNLQDFEEFDSEEKNSRGVRNRETGLQYIHDFPLDYSITEYFPIFLEKYTRRINRLYTDIENANNILFIFVSRFNNMLSIGEIKEGYNMIEKKYPSKNIDFLVMLSSKECDKYETKYFNLTKNIDIYLYSDIPNRVDGNSEIIKKIILNKCGYEYHPINEKICSIGLADAEDWGRWSADRDVLLQLRTNFINQNIKVHVSCAPYLDYGRNFQNVEVFCNNIKLADWNFLPNASINTDLYIDKKINSKNGILSFEFIINDPKSPYELSEGKAEDRRKIAVSFFNILISRYDK